MQTQPTANGTGRTTSAETYTVRPATKYERRMARARVSVDGKCDMCGAETFVSPSATAVEGAPPFHYCPGCAEFMDGNAEGEREASLAAAQLTFQVALQSGWDVAELVEAIQHRPDFAL